MKAEVSGSKRPTTAHEKTPTDSRPRQEGHPNLLKGNIGQGLGRPRKVLKKLGTGRAPTRKEIRQFPDRNPVKVRRMLWEWGKTVTPRPTRRQLAAGQLPPRVLLEYLIKNKGTPLADGRRAGGHVRVGTADDVLFLQCWPSCARMAEDLGVSVWTVKRRVKDLIQQGILYARRKRRPDGTLGPRYLMLCPGILPQKSTERASGRETEKLRARSNTESRKGNEIFGSSMNIVKRSYLRVIFITKDWTYEHLDTFPRIIGQAF